jgi:hypothetical protein
MHSVRRTTPQQPSTQLFASADQAPPGIFKHRAREKDATVLLFRTHASLSFVTMEQAMQIGRGVMHQ